MRTRTGYSFRTAVGHLPDVAARLKEIGSSVGPISDRCSTFGFVKWTKACKAAGLRPIYGVELAVVPALGEKKPVIDYWTFFALDALRPLHDLVEKATSASGKEPSLLYETALNAPGVLKIAGERCQVDRIEPRPDLYMALSPALPKGLFKSAQAAGHQFIAASDNVFPTAADREWYRVTLGWRSGTQTYPQHILDPLEWAQGVERFADAATIAAAIENQRAAQERCRAELLKADLLVPEKPKTLRAMCEEGAQRLGTDLNDPVYAARLERELTLIRDKGFEDYFYIIADMIAWAKERMIVGPARGSSCGSLACYLLGITTIDPIPFGLIFERFIDVNRTDLPDIDIDFSDTRRSLVFDYIEQKYGRDHVARLGTVGLFKPRSALKQAGAGLRVPSWKVEKVLENLTERSSGDARAMMALEDTLRGTETGKALVKDEPEILIATRMEGHPNNASQHAAGIVLTNRPIAEFVAVDKRTKAAMCDKKDAEALNLLKIDALGLTQLSIFERTLELIGRPTKSGWLETLPLDDQAAFDILNDGKFAGIFQFTGMSLQSLVKQIKINHIEDMISITALARPGPMATGGANSWVKRRNGREEISTAHPMLTELTKETYGITVYQEQVMNIVRHMGKMSWEDTSAIRKAMSGRLGNEFFESYWQKFKTGAIENGISEPKAKEIWDQINTFGSWAFNRSHAVAYGLVSYWSCWLKAHHPLEFAAATLDAESDPARQIQLLRELALEGIDYVSIDPERSVDRWTAAERAGKRILVGPLTAIKGIGPAAMKEILTCRARGEEIRPALAKRLASAVTEIDSLFPIRDAVHKLHPSLEAAGIVTQPTPIKDVQMGLRGDVVVICTPTRIAPRDENDEQKLAARGYALKGPTQALNLFIRDDSDEMFCKVDRFQFERMGREIVNRGKVNKAIYAIKGTVPKDFRMISVKQIKYLGDLP